MRFYYIKDEYIHYLQRFDNKVELNKNESRPYVGIVFQVGDIKYYAPFTSPKAKHQRMKNGKDFRKIADGKLGAINFNNMIPVPDNVLIMLDFNSVRDLSYRRLLQNQYRAIKEDMKEIEETAKKLRDLILTEDSNLTSYDKHIKSRCCNLALLETVYLQYKE